MSVNDLEKIRLHDYVKGQTDLAKKIRSIIINGDMVDVLELLDEV